MKKALVFGILCLLGCENQQAYPPVGGVLTDKDLKFSQQRAKNLNELERMQITDWIKNQDEKFYPMGLNYWVNVENLHNNPKKEDGTAVSYQYDIYDFDGVKIYSNPIVNVGVLGKFSELKAVEDALRYLSPNQEVRLLIPSVLAYGTYGDNDKIPSDMPLIIVLKMNEI
ncbi:MAG: hypothetical protein Q4C75_04020 [Bergeyella zoohelcum]|nr:hypothetical protein [Bergeyella zoohelcum]